MLGDKTAGVYCQDCQAQPARVGLATVVVRGRRLSSDGSSALLSGQRAVPVNAPTGNPVSAVLTIGGVTSNTVTIAVQ